MRYPHTLTITRTTESTPDTDADGNPIPGTGETTKTIYDGKGDYQDGLSEYERAQSGDADIDATGVLFFPDSEDVFDVQEDDEITITDSKDRTVGSGTVKGKRLLDNKLFVKLD